MALKTSRQKFLEAIEQCRLSRIISLVKHGHNIHMENIFGQNFLVHLLQQQQQPQQNSLISKKRFQIFQFLITNYNVNIHSFDQYGKNIFNWAANLNCTQEALYLLHTFPGDIDILARDSTGSCSLHYAVEHGNDILVHGIVNYLLRYRLRFDIKDAHHHTPEDLARKLGYEKIAHFLSQACRSTIFLSREIPTPPPPSTQQNQRPMTAKSKSSTSMASSTLIDSSEYFNLIETRINLAKSLDDWKTVTALRAFKKNSNEKSYLNKIPDPTPKINISRPSTAALPLILTPSQPEQMLRLIEPQITSSFRRSFTPVYQQPILANVGYQRSFNIQRKMSQTSSRHVSSVLSQRKRDSECSQISVSILPDVQNRIAIPPVYKQYRQSTVTTN